jgi:hypothetical protein
MTLRPENGRFGFNLNSVVPASAKPNSYFTDPAIIC